MAAAVGSFLLGTYVAGCAFLYAKNKAWKRAEITGDSLRETARQIPGADPSAIPKASAMRDGP